MFSPDVSLDSLRAFLKPLFITALSILKSILKHNVERYKPDSGLQCPLNRIKNRRTRTNFNTMIWYRKLSQNLQNKQNDEQRNTEFSLFNVE